MQDAQIPLPLNPGNGPLALFLDLDGTLLELASRPELVEVPESLLQLLTRLNDGLDGALALISGRALNNMDLVMAPLRLTSAGSHGLEMRQGDSSMLSVASPISVPHEVTQRLKELARECPGLLIEPKTAGIAVHFRQAPLHAERVREVLHELVGTLGSDFELLDGKMLLEMRPAGAHKGLAIEQFMQLPPFAGRTPVFLGDDITDEDGFYVVNELGGYSARVGTAPGSVARYRLSDVTAVHGWLAGLAGSLEAVAC